MGKNIFSNFFDWLFEKGTDIRFWLIFIVVLISITALVSLYFETGFSSEYKTMVGGPWNPSTVTEHPSLISYFFKFFQKFFGYALVFPYGIFLVISGITNSIFGSLSGLLFVPLITIFSYTLFLVSFDQIKKNTGMRGLLTFLWMFLFIFSSICWCVSAYFQFKTI